MAIKIQGHRGVRFHNGIPESSEKSFNAAIGEGAEGIEWDVNLVNDGVLAVTHGEPELTNRDQFPEMNNNAYLTAFTWEELSTLHLRDHTGTLTEERMPTNNDVLDVIDAYRKRNMGNPVAAENERAKNFMAVIEIKDPGAAPAQAYIIGAVEKVVEDIKSRIGKDGWREANFEVRSFNMDILQAAREQLDKAGLGKVTIGALIAGRREDGWDIKDRAQFEQTLADIERRKIRPDNISLTWQSFSPLTSEAIKRLGFKTGKIIKRNAWTWQEEAMDTPQKREAMYASLVKNDVDTVICDNPGRVRH